MVAYQVTLQINTQDIGVREEICSIGAIDSDFTSAESCIAVLRFLCNVCLGRSVLCECRGILSCKVMESLI